MSETENKNAVEAATSEATRIVGEHQGVAADATSGITLAAGEDAPDESRESDASPAADEQVSDDSQSSGEQVPDQKQTTSAPSTPDILYISGSPRAHTCESLVGIIENGAHAAGARSQHFFLSKKKIVPCTGCNACIKTGICVLASRTSGDRMIDDYLELKAALDRVDALALIAPLFFAGPPAQLKALFDRMQPYWTQCYALGQTPRPKRPAQLFIVGGGNAYGHDPHGHEPLVGIAKSALAVAGFSLEKVHNFVGYRSGKDKPLIPSAEQREQLPLGELAQLKRAVAAQEDFEQRARDAGGALARFVVWSRTSATE